MTFEFEDREVVLLYEALSTKHKKISDEIKILNDAPLGGEQWELRLSDLWNELEKVNKLKYKILEGAYNL